ncbi:uncharacterized protein ARMOST_17310 [Armillaria ostoyae]|uniref:Uncharacterized protein n=1 Tax=Armillaria ostoyae TaxID=47428 RepID=A0A284RYM8_ARMOS|nr:uncharacterized protein ARMOST_17310 [Armillaria ostoyae]
MLNFRHAHRLIRTLTCKWRVSLQHSGLGTDDDTSSIHALSSTQSSPGPADRIEIARSFQPQVSYIILYVPVLGVLIVSVSQTELLNPCAKINEFILNTHLHVNVAITHSDGWSSTLSQGDDSDVLLRVVSDYMVIVRNVREPRVTASKYQILGGPGEASQHQSIDYAILPRVVFFMSDGHVGIIMTFVAIALPLAVYCAGLLLWRILRHSMLRKQTCVLDLKQLGLSRNDNQKIHGTAVICGGSFAGLFAARVCHDHFDEVVIVEPEAWANDPEAKCQDAWNQAKPRSRVMQYKSLQGGLIVSLNRFKGLTS